MATSYTTLQTALTNLSNQLGILQVQCSLTASHSTALTGTYDQSGDLVTRVNNLAQQLLNFSQELGRVDTSLTS